MDRHRRCIRRWRVGRGCSPELVRWIASRRDAARSRLAWRRPRRRAFRRSPRWFQGRERFRRAVASEFSRRRLQLGLRLRAWRRRWNCRRRRKTARPERERWRCAIGMRASDRAAAFSYRLYRAYQFPAAADSAASFLFLLRMTTQETPMPTKYKPSIGAMKMSMVMASGVGVMMAATTAMMAMA